MTAVPFRHQPFQARQSRRRYSTPVNADPLGSEAVDAAGRWSRTWTHVGAPQPPGLLDELLAAYSQPHRAYHTTTHLAECFAHLDAFPGSPSEPAAVELALWFHYTVYDTRSGENEAKSAAWCREALSHLGSGLLDTIEGLILVTAHNASPSTDDQALLLDVDLSILGAEPERFNEYEAEVRREFEWVPEDVYRAARLKILTEFHHRERLFHTPHFHSQLEAQAHRNLERSIEALAAY